MHRYLFWTEPNTKLLRRLNLATNDVIEFPSREAYTIVIACAFRRIYWLEKHNHSRVNHIYSSDYRGQHLKNITNGSLNHYTLGVVGDLLYFHNHDRFYINEMNVLNGQISRRIQLQEKYSYYFNLTIVQVIRGKL